MSTSVTASIKPQSRMIDGLTIRYADTDRSQEATLLLTSPWPESLYAFAPMWATLAKHAGHGKIELSRFLTPPVVADHRNAPVNALGYLRVMFAVDDLDETLDRLRKHGAQRVAEIVQYED